MTLMLGCSVNLYYANMAKRFVKEILHISILICSRIDGYSPSDGRQLFMVINLGPR